MEDYDLWLRLADRRRPYYDDRPTVVVRRRRGSARASRRSMAECALRVLEPRLAAAVAAGVLREPERRARLGRLWHDLAYAGLREADGKAARQAARRAIALLPGQAKTYMYLLAAVISPRASSLVLHRRPDPRR
jgi:hypothetical protein